jgi:hypothetical protein
MDGCDGLTATDWRLRRLMGSFGVPVEQAAAKGEHGVPTLAKSRRSPLDVGLHTCTYHVP